MVRPVESRTMEFENDSFHILFDVQYKKIVFTILNKMEDGIRINWDEVSFSLNGRAKRTVHKETGEYKIRDVQPPTTIPPKSSLKDFLIPTDIIRYGRIGYSNYTIIGNILPLEASGKTQQRDVIRKYKGTKITVFLPFYIAGKYVTRYYDLMINDVTVSKTKQKPR